LDARNLAGEWPSNNLTSRGLILNLGNGCWACFDTELLRMSVIWDGPGITPVSMSQGSYQVPGSKVGEGENKLPRIIGKPWSATGLYPGWQGGEPITLDDPRDPGPDPRELGRGPLPEAMGRFKALQFIGQGVRLEYVAHGAKVAEEVVSSIEGGEPKIERRFHIEKIRAPLRLVLGRMASGKTAGLRVAGNDERSSSPVELSKDANGIAIVRIKQSRKPINFVVTFRSGTGNQAAVHEHARPTKAFSNLTGAQRWPQRLTTRERRGTNEAAFILDEIELPLENPWRRNIRLADIAFFKDGRAATVTFDGDVWLISGLGGKQNAPVWQRYAAGFHEPLGLCIRDGEIFVYDRNGIWRLRDTNHDGEADRYELFSNEFAQTAETREFASGIRLAPDGSFIIAKGGQEKSFVGKANGKILRVSPDGKRFTTLGWGLRQPFIGVNPRTGLVTASDQQGHYVPTTPLHIIRDNQYYGFLPGFAPAEKYPAPIAEPFTWIPYAVNASGAAQVWLMNARMGPLNDALIHFGYYRPELFVVRFNDRGSHEQAAVISVTQDFEFAPLNGAVNPADGQLYVTGFQIWGTTAKQISGLARLRYTGAPCTLPREVAAMDKGILLRFDVPLERNKATDPASFSIERWNYKRTPNYGSPHYKLDGSLGQEWMSASSAYLSKDRKSVFIGVPDMKPAMQMRIGWALITAAGPGFEQNAYFTPRELTKIDLKKEGFAPVQIDLTPRARPPSATVVSAVEGKKLASLMGCAACHSTDGTLIGKVGPTWKGLYGTERTFTKGEPAVADDDYLRQSMLEPTAKTVKGFDKSDAGMPSYAGVLTDDQIRSLILFIQTLK
jgi:mono/diheme cytochrome c family protein